LLQPSDRLIASIGIGGKGQSDIAMFHKREGYWFPDVDTRRAAKTVNAFLKRNFIKIKRNV
jgi:hypothetical protein